LISAAATRRIRCAFEAKEFSPKARTIVKSLKKKQTQPKCGAVLKNKFFESFFETKSAKSTATK